MNGRMAIACAGMILACGCATEVPEAFEVSLDQRAMSAALEPQDVRRTVDKMVDSMLADPDLVAQIGSKRPVLDITGVKNRSSLHLDTTMITDSIRTKLIRSKKFRFIDRTTSADDLAMMNAQLNGLNSTNKAVRVGQQSAAQMYLYGDLNEMRQQAGDVTDRYFKFTLNLKDLKSGEIIWSDEQEIRKEQTRKSVSL